MASIIELLVVICMMVGLSHQKKTTVIENLYINTDIRYRFATTTVSSTISNPTYVTREIDMDVILPENAFISSFVMDIEGKEYQGHVEEKSTAKRKYLKAKKEGESAGHLAARPRDTNRFIVQVNIKAHKKVAFNLTYQEVLRRKKGYYDHTVYINPGEPVDDLRVNVNLVESRYITFLRVPPIRDDLLSSMDMSRDNPLVNIYRPNNVTAHISFHPTTQEQMNSNPWGISGMFSVLYDIERDFDAGDVLIIDGYFVHFFAPKLTYPLPKDILFILDTSVSMDFGKLDQLKSAMRVILNQLRPGDRFNILDFNTYSDFWNNEDMVPVNDVTLLKAMEQIDNLQTQGATDINEAMVKGVNFLYDHASEHNRSVVIFLTDGRSTVGETLDSEILKNIRDENRYHIPIYTLAFGAYADWPLMKKIAVQNEGFARRIYEEADSALQIQGFYDEVSTSMVTDLDFDYLDESVDRDTITSRKFSNYFNGSELLVAGRIANGSWEIPINVHGNTSLGEMELTLAAREEREEAREEFKGITEKMWAYLAIQDILRKRDGAIDEDEREDLKQQAIDLSLKYNLVTPVTSMVVTKPGDTDQSDQSDLISTHEGEGFNIGQFGGWRNRGRVGGDPHFMVDIVDMEVPVCYDVKGRNNDVFQLIQDPDLDLRINIKMKLGKKKDRNGHQRKFIKAVAVLYKELTVVVKLDTVVINGKDFKWEQYKILHRSGATIRIEEDEAVLIITLENGLPIIIDRHQHWSHDDATGDDFINVDIQKENKLSHKATGVLGMFIHKHVTAKEYRLNGRHTAIIRMMINGRLQGDSAILAKRHDPLVNATVPCWSLPEHGKIQKHIQSFQKKHFLDK